MPTNGDNIAQDNEIGPSNTRTFGAAPDRHFDPDSKRPYDLEYTLGVEREVISDVSVAGTWFRRESYNFQQTIEITYKARLPFGSMLEDGPRASRLTSRAPTCRIRTPSTTATRVCSACPTGTASRCPAVLDGHGNLDSVLPQVMALLTFICGLLTGALHSGLVMRSRQ